MAKKQTGEGGLLAKVLREAEAVRAVVERREATITAIAEETGIARHRVYRMLRAMQAAGFPLRARPSPDARGGQAAQLYRWKKK